VNTYTFTKALAESYVAKHGQGMPMVIFRPAVVSNSVKEPVAGWVDAVHGTAGTLLAIAHGVFRNSWMGPSSPLYLVPVDFCANLMLAIAWEVGTRQIRLVQDLR
jgi:fatty acyl-CoA reductase